MTVFFPFIKIDLLQQEKAKSAGNKLMIFS